MPLLLIILPTRRVQAVRGLRQPGGRSSQRVQAVRRQAVRGYRQSGGRGSRGYRQSEGRSSQKAEAIRGNSH